MCPPPPCTQSWTVRSVSPRRAGICSQVGHMHCLDGHSLFTCLGKEPLKSVWSPVSITIPSFHPCIHPSSILGTELRLRTRWTWPCLPESYTLFLCCVAPPPPPPLPLPCGRVSKSLTPRRTWRCCQCPSSSYQPMKLLGRTTFPRMHCAVVMGPLLPPLQLFSLSHSPWIERLPEPQRTILSPVRQRRSAQYSCGHRPWGWRHRCGKWGPASCLLSYPVARDDLSLGSSSQLCLGISPPWTGVSRKV